MCQIEIMVVLIIVVDLVVVLDVQNVEVRVTLLRLRIAIILECGVLLAWEAGPLQRRVWQQIGIVVDAATTVMGIVITIESTDLVSVIGSVNKLPSCGRPDRYLFSF